MDEGREEAEDESADAVRAVSEDEEGFKMDDANVTVGASFGDADDSEGS